MSLFTVLVVCELAWTTLTAESGASETDQFIAMDAQIKDSAEALNHFLNAQAAEFLDIQNAHRSSIQTVEALTEKYYFYLFPEFLFDTKRTSW
ncbi:MAG: hypothetical protein HY706_07695 [Candidatus Hydrogenedentes bacterium]|nr:hypothetical protein [Candidatus Hydrogenedentota bacterium]